MTDFHDAVEEFLDSMDQMISESQLLQYRGQAFMAYAMCLCALSLRTHHYNVNAANTPDGFWFKCSPRGNPCGYSHFDVSSDNTRYELRMNIDVVDRDYSFAKLKLNLDVVLIKADTVHPTTHDVDSDDLLAFIECKDRNGYPELVATFEGQIYNIQGGRFYNRTKGSYRFPCCLFLSGYADTVEFKDRYYQSTRRPVRIFGDMRPGEPAIDNFIRNWF